MFSVDGKDTQSGATSQPKNYNIKSNILLLLPLAAPSHRLLRHTGVAAVRLRQVSTHRGSSTFSFLSLILSYTFSFILSFTLSFILSFSHFRSFFHSLSFSHSLSFFLVSHSLFLFFLSLILFLPPSLIQ